MQDWWTASRPPVRRKHEEAPMHDTVTRRAMLGRLGGTAALLPAAGTAATMAACGTGGQSGVSGQPSAQSVGPVTIRVMHRGAPAQQEELELAVKLFHEKFGLRQWKAEMDFFPSSAGNYNDKL